jgi:transcription-repair coupling factor (superfamily II helicase)
MYKRISNAKDKQQLHELQIELIDRFGLLPPPVKHLLLITDLKLKAQQMGVLKISAGAQQGKIDFNENPSIDPGVLISLIQVHAKRYQMEGPQRLRFTLDSTTPEERIFEIHSLLDKLMT